MLPPNRSRRTSRSSAWTCLMSPLPGRATTSSNRASRTAAFSAGGAAVSAAGGARRPPGRRLRRDFRVLRRTAQEAGPANRRCPFGGSARKRRPPRASAGRKHRRGGSAPSRRTRAGAANRRDVLEALEHESARPASATPSSACRRIRGLLASISPVARCGIRRDLGAGDEVAELGELDEDFGGVSPPA